MSAGFFPINLSSLPSRIRGNCWKLLPDHALVRCWRLLFHARVHLAVQDRIAEKSLNPSALRERIHAIGEVEFDEIRTVLGQEGYLLPPRNDRRHI